ncbi:MAG: type II toxin-antitoxin system VapC family toxin [Gemmataceae bacterium]
MPEYVLDASALIALVNEEPGANKVRPLMPHSVISAVNLCETIQRLRRGGIPLEAVTLALSPLLSPPIPFDGELAYIAASIHEQTRDYGLSFGDCSCLALALSLKVPAVTAERAWDKFDIGVRVIKIR